MKEILNDKIFYNRLSESSATYNSYELEERINEKTEKTFNKKRNRDKGYIGLANKTHGFIIFGQTNIGKNINDDHLLLNCLTKYYDDKNQCFLEPVLFLNTLLKTTNGDKLPALSIKVDKNIHRLYITGYSKKNNNEEESFLPNQKWHFFFSVLAGKIIGNCHKKEFEKLAKDRKEKLSEFAQETWGLYSEDCLIGWLDEANSLKGKLKSITMTSPVEEFLDRNILQIKMNLKED